MAQRLVSSLCYAVCNYGGLIRTISAHALFPAVQHAHHACSVHMLYFACHCPCCKPADTALLLIGPCAVLQVLLNALALPLPFHGLSPPTVATLAPLLLSAVIWLSQPRAQRRHSLMRNAPALAVGSLSDAHVCGADDAAVQHVTLLHYGRNATHLNVRR
jgi:hypothetical protein